MDIATFHASRRYADVKSGRIAFFERGQGSRVAVFVHGVPLNGYHWRNVIERDGRDVLAAVKNGIQRVREAPA